MTRPRLDSSMEAVLDQLMGDAGTAQRDGDLAACIAKLGQAWDLVPEPKLQWDYYGQILSLEASKACIEHGVLAEAAVWVERLDDAYAPHSEASRPMVDFVKAKLYYRAGERDLAHAYFDAIYKVSGKRAFRGEPDEYYEFYTSYSPGREEPTMPVGAAGWEVRVPEPGVGEVLEVLGDDVHAEIVRLLGEGDNYMDLDAPQAAAEQYVAAIELLPQPYTQWEAALMLTVALGDACLALTQYAEAEESLRIALRSPDGTGNGYVWLRLGDALRGQDRDGEALEAYTSAYMLEGEELFEDEDDAWAMLEQAGIPE
ncbi:MAG: hypothetical protein GX596_08400 [Propionibacterium sp.]|nr:hypothetical protein [Propionibacterium sp.]